jgi:CheY-like chemotaxis protein
LAEDSFRLGGTNMETKNLLQGKRILIVDDEPDVLAALEGLLEPLCHVVKASGFDEAKSLLESYYFDIVILDIMGGNGYELLEIAIKKNVLAVMLTAHALSPDNIVKSFEGGAASYLPKEEMEKIADHLNEILEAKEKGKHPWWHWLDRWSSFYQRKFGPDWQKDNEEFWKKLSYL